MRSFIEAVDPSSTRWDEFTDILQRRAEEYLQPLDIRLDFEATVDPELEYMRPLVRHHLTGIVREALGNIIKHAHAGRVDIQLAVRKGGGHLVIQDDGKGMDVSRFREGTHGLVHMDQRAQEMDGALAIRAMEQGTRLDIHFLP